MKNERNVDREALCRRAKELFVEERYACSDAVLTVMNEALGSPIPADALRAATGFRGGMGDGDVCGAVSGGIMALGLALAPAHHSMPSPELKEAVKAFRARFAARNGCIDCADLTARFASMDDPARRDFCGGLVEGVVADLVDFSGGSTGRPQSFSLYNGPHTISTEGVRGMDFLELAKKRFSVRKYRDRPVEPEKLAAILEAGRVAPTAANGQPQRIVVVRSPEGLAKLERGVNPYNAPLALIVCCDVADSFYNPLTKEGFGKVDTAIVTTHMMLEATDLGLGSIWIGQFDADEVRRDFGVPREFEVMHILLVGYPDCETDCERHTTTRRPLKETVFSESF